MLTNLKNFCTKSAARTALFLCILSTLYGFPEFEKLHEDPNFLSLKILHSQIDNPFKPQDLTQIDAYGPNRAFRITVPLMGQMFRTLPVNQQLFGLWILKLLGGFIFFYVLYDYILKRFGSKEKAFYFTLGTSVMFVGNTFFFDMEWFIAWGYLFLLLAMISKNTLLSILYLLLAFFTDERAVIASFCVVFFWVYADNRNLVSSILKYGMGLGIYAVLYLILKYYCHLGYAQTNDFFTRILDQFNVIPLTVSLSIKSYWYYFCFLLFPIKSIPTFHKILLFGAILVLIFFSLSIADTTKSLAFLFLYGFCGFCMAAEEISARTVRAIALTALFIPTYIFVGWQYAFVRPFGYQYLTKGIEKTIKHFKK